jgi:signal transduction histidine kinase
MSDRVVELVLDRRASIPALVVRDQVIAAMSPAALELLGGGLGAPVAVLFDDSSRDKLAAAFADAPASCEVQVRLGGRELVAASASVIPLAHNELLVLLSRVGAVYSAAMAEQLLAANDRLANLTRELSRQSAELEVARARSESLAELREHFISMLAHDVRGALNSIALGVEAIKRYGERAGAVIERIHHSTKYILDLVDVVLESARTETGRIVIDARPVSPHAIVREAMAIYAPLADRAHLHLELIDDGRDAMVSGDRVRLGQVIGNLLENAIRHSPAQATITLQVTVTAAAVQIAIRDRGRGISPDLRDQIFERFVQGRGAGGSLGLGLYVARQLVELHQGRIRVEDVAPHGAAFIIELPRLT